MVCSIPSHVWKKILGGGEEGKREGMKRSQRRRSVISSLPVPVLMVPVWLPGCSPNPPLLPIPLFLIPLKWWWIDLTQRKWLFNAHIFLVIHRWGLGFVKGICCLLLLCMCIWNTLWQKISCRKNIYPFQHPQNLKFVFWYMSLHLLVGTCWWTHVHNTTCVRVHFCVCVCVLFIKGSLWS